MTEDAKIKGPASYFPSIEKKYGHPITHWLNLLAAVNGKKHMEMVAWLKTEHGMGHGHANALVAYYLVSAKNP
ncbi:conserved hypothetical protein [Shewanella denitrificans OS217]|uniref:DUF4287 domain-containing protein n=1 Tax=Shewanella denitrificans (strain OS217 / ATCC BAA-1090 / DSM 15013) TaxID=318161 RepID=Q12MW0_SHEDO|nr:DUF4287 domain-containing protein [Shewanella denitrificans]ABE55216.1 conserved hypothetical protein [Shewanella denitrificans OS217]